MCEQNEKFNKELEIIKRTKQILEMKNIMNEVKNAIDIFNNRINQAEEKIFELENRSLHLIQSEENKEIRMKKSEEEL